LFDAYRIASKALQTAQEAQEDQKKVTQKRIVSTVALCAISICICSAVYVANISAPEGETVIIGANPVPLAALPSDLHAADDLFVCPVCGNEVDETTLE